MHTWVQQQCSWHAQLYFLRCDIPRTTFPQVTSSASHSTGGWSWKGWATFLALHKYCSGSADIQVQPRNIEGIEGTTFSTFSSTFVQESLPSRLSKTQTVLVVSLLSNLWLMNETSGTTMDTEGVDGTTFATFSSTFVKRSPPSWLSNTSLFQTDYSGYYCRGNNLPGECCYQRSLLEGKHDSKRGLTSLANFFRFFAEFYDAVPWYKGPVEASQTLKQFLLLNVWLRHET